MFPLPVPTTRPTSREALDEMVEKLESVYDKVRRRAFDSFIGRGEKFGSDLEDWFNAERELFRLPESEVKETESAFEIRAAVPGFKVDDLHVQVLPELIVIEGKVDPPVADAKPEGEKVHFSEFAKRRLFRQYKLGLPVDTAKVEATLSNGILTVVATKLVATSPAKAIEVPIHMEVVKAPPVALAATAAK